MGKVKKGFDGEGGVTEVIRGGNLKIRGREYLEDLLT